MAEVDDEKKRIDGISRMLNSNLHLGELLPEAFAMIKEATTMVETKAEAGTPLEGRQLDEWSEWKKYSPPEWFVQENLQKIFDAVVAAYYNLKAGLVQRRAMRIRWYSSGCTEGGDGSSMMKELQTSATSIAHFLQFVMNTKRLMRILRGKEENTDLFGKALVEADHIRYLCSNI
jgi:hypothetical protein